jgi:SNF2 family DNA or RNA helicase
VLAKETISKLNKIDQIASGFVYLTTKNPGLCNGCVHVHRCSSEGVSPYTTACAIASKEPPAVIERASKNARLERCVGLLETLLEDATNKIIIWARYIPELDDLEKTITDLGYKIVRVQGGLSREALTDAMSTFNTDPACRVYLGQVSTGVGVTLNAANYMIYYNLPWSLDHYLQSIDRNYRIGQTRKVTVYRLIGHYTLDVSKKEALDQKIDFSKLVTSKTVCATCPDFYKRCNKHKIKLYDVECKYDHAMMRKTASLGVIP